MVSIKLKSGKTVSVDRKGDGVDLTIKTLIGNFSEQLTKEEASALLFALEQTLYELDISAQQAAQRVEQGMASHD
jgi:hypothetical protein